MKKIVLNNGVEISTTSKPFFIGEVGINHNGNIDIARKIIDMASQVGIDSVKFQKRDYLKTISKDLLNSPYNKDSSFGKTYLDHKRRLEFDDKDLKHLFDYAFEKSLIPCSSAFCIESYDYIERNFNPLFHKIPSPLIVNPDLLSHVAKYNKPIFISTGMSYLNEIDLAVESILKWNNELVLMQCTSLYPTENFEVNLRVIDTYKERYGLLTGFSSHDKSVVFPAVAHALGACVFEKHITIDRTMKGPDHSSSFEKRGLELAYGYLLSSYEALGSSKKTVLEREIGLRKKHLQSIVASKLRFN